MVVLASVTGRTLGEVSTLCARKLELLGLAVPHELSCVQLRRAPVSGPYCAPSFICPMGVVEHTWGGTGVFRSHPRSMRAKGVALTSWTWLKAPFSPLSKI